MAEQGMTDAVERAECIARHERELAKKERSRATEARADAHEDAVEPWDDGAAG